MRRGSRKMKKKGIALGILAFALAFGGCTTEGMNSVIYHTDRNGNLVVTERGPKPSVESADEYGPGIDDVNLMTNIPPGWRVERLANNRFIASIDPRFEFFAAEQS